MPGPADTSNTERIRRLRSNIQAYSRSVRPTALEQGPIGPVDESTVLSRSFGQMAYLRPNATGAVVTQQPCCT